MSDERFDRLQELFRQVSELPEEERAEWLTGQCGTDEALQRDVEKLLHQFERTHDPLEEMAGQVAAEPVSPEPTFVPEDGPVAPGQTGTRPFLSATSRKLRRSVRIR